MAATVCVLIFSHGAMAQMFKCTDGAGKTTYSSQPCRELGLKDAGEVKDRLQVTPAPVYQSAPPPPSRGAREEPVQKPAAATEDAAKQPERRCFTITTKGGKKAIRCNDKPDEE